jgi:hypothetical protein
MTKSIVGFIPRRLPNPFGHTTGDEISGMLNRDDARAVARRCFIADHQHRLIPV